MATQHALTLGILRQKRLTPNQASANDVISMVLNMTQPQDKTLLLVDDDKPFLTRLGPRHGNPGLCGAHGRHGGRWHCPGESPGPGYAVIDLRLTDGNGLDVIEALHAARPDARVVVLTGYGNIATAVTAVKLGAIDYLAKPADADAVYGALMSETAEARNALPENPMSADRVRWEHIQRVFELCNRNVSETARRLNMHRRTLQRILAKRAPK